MRLLRTGDGWKAEVPSAHKPWTVQVFSPSGRELLVKSVPQGSRSVTFMHPTMHTGVFLVILRQGGVAASSVLVEP